MNSDYMRQMNCRHLPARLSAEQVGFLLGLSLDEVRILSSEEILERLWTDADTPIRKQLLNPHQRLKPLGEPRRQSRKYYSTQSLEKLADSVTWLNGALFTIREYWHRERACPS